MPRYEEENGLTAEEFKNKMYGHLKKKGHIDALKTQLRYKIVEELRGTSVIKFPSEAGSDDEIGFKLANSLVADHLRRNQYDYSLSVFLPESGSSHDQLYAAREVLHMLHIPPDTELYRRLLDQVSSKPKKAILQTFLTEISRAPQALINTRPSQTTTKTDSQESLGDKLLRLDQLHSTKRSADDQTTYLQSEERLLAYQRHLEERARTDVKAQVERFREHELSTIRIEERDKCRKELSDARMEMERVYQAKMEALKERERNATERVQRMQEGQEKEIFTQRQSVLGELELLRHRESQVRREMESNEKDLRLREERLKNLENDLRRKEMDVKQAENEFNIKLKDEMNRFRLEEEARYTQRVKQLEQAELANSEDRKIIDSEKQTLCELRTDLHDKQMKLNELETIDYKYVKEENSMLKRELDVIKSRYGEMQQELEGEKMATSRLQQQLAELSMRPPGGQSVNLRSREAGNRSVEEENRILEEKLAKEEDTNKEILARFEEHSQHYKEMSQEISQLRSQLLSTQRALKRGHVPNYTNSGARSGSESDLSTAAEDYYETPLAKTNPEPELQLMQSQYGSYRRSTGRKHRTRLDSSLDSGDEIVVDAWKRLKQLEAETENLESSYRSFQARMSTLHSACIPNETVRTTAARYRVVFADTVSDTRDVTSRADATSRTDAMTSRDGIMTSRDGTGTSYKAGQFERAAPHSRVSFEQPSKASPPFSQTIAPRSKTPLSSTPYRPKIKPSRSDESSPLDLKAHLSSDPLPSLELSTVTSGTTSSDQRPAPLPADRSSDPRQLNVADLEAGSQSPSVVVVSGSQTTLATSDSLDHGQPDQTQNTSHGQDSTLKSHEPSNPQIDATPLELLPDDLATPSPAPLDVTPAHRDVTETPSFDTPPAPTRLPMIERPPPLPPVSLDDAWKTSQVETSVRPLVRYSSSEELRRKQQEEEDRKFEEQRSKREEWRRRSLRDDDTKEEPETGRGKSKTPSPTSRSPVPAEDSAKPEAADSGPAIDPVMQKYMDMVAAQKQKKEAETVPGGPPERVSSPPDRAVSPVHSELQSEDFSAGGLDDDNVQKKSKTNDDSDSFEW